MKGMDDKWLKDKGLILQKDGTYKKVSNTSKAIQRGKALEKGKTGTSEGGHPNEGVDSTDEEPFECLEVGSKFTIGYVVYDEEGYRSVEIRLFGKPMAKQSVKFFAYIDKRTGKPTARSYQPEKFKEREEDYRRQILEQLPEGFEMFTEEVVIEEYTVIFPALKGFSKAKMDRIRAGELFKKTTRPDLPDNLKKLALDSMSGLVFEDDGLIWKECESSKVYGTGGCIIIKLKGK